MTMLSFRAETAEADAAQELADRLGIDRSEFLRQALHRHVARCRAHDDARTWAAAPLTDDESALAGIADWGPAEDWSDWQPEP